MSADNQPRNPNSQSYVPEMTPRWLIGLLRKYGEDDAVLMGQQVRPQISYDDDDDFSQAETVVPGVTDVLDDIAANAPTVPSADQLATSIEWGDAPEPQPEAPVTSSAMDDLLASFNDLDAEPESEPEPFQPGEVASEPEDWSLTDDLDAAEETPLTQPSEADIPDWLNEFEELESEVSSPLFAEGEAETPVAGGEEAEQTDVPDWLFQFAGGDEETSPETESEGPIQPSFSDETEDDTPALTEPEEFSADADWLSELGFSSEDDTKSAASSTSEEADEGDWLSELGISEPEQEEPKPTPPLAETESADEFGWLDELEAQDKPKLVEAILEPAPVEETEAAKEDEDWDADWLAEVAQAYPVDPQDQAEAIAEEPPIEEVPPQVEDLPTPLSVTSMLDMGKVPDWLGETDTPEDDLPAEEELTFADDAPDWMADLDSIAAETDEPDVALPSQVEPEAAQPDWMASLRQGIQDASADDEEAQPDELSGGFEDVALDIDTQPELDISTPVASETSLVEDAPEDYVDTLPAVIPEEQPAFEMDLPDWMQDLTDVEEIGSLDDEAEIVAEEPSALSLDEEQPPSRTGEMPGVPEKPETSEPPLSLDEAADEASVDIGLEGEETPDWLEKLSALQEEAQADEDLASEEELFDAVDSVLEAEEPEVVDQLVDLGEPEQPAEEPGVEAEEEVVPDWLADLRQEISIEEQATEDVDVPSIPDEPVELEEPDAADLDWLAEVQTPEEAEIPAEVIDGVEMFESLDDDADVPDWLSDLRREADEADAGQISETELETPVASETVSEAEDIFEVDSDLEIEEAFTSRIEDDVPGWLANLQTEDEEPEADVPAEEVEEETPELEVDSLEPEIETELEAEMEPASVSESEEDFFTAEADLPDWMITIVDPETVTDLPAEPEEMPVDDEAVEVSETELVAELPVEAEEAEAVAPLETGPAETEVDSASEEDDVPGWLAALRHEAEPDDEIDAAELVGDDPFALPDDDKRPGWLIDHQEEDDLFGVSLDEEPESSEAEAEIQAEPGLEAEEPAELVTDIPDWMQNLPDRVDSWDVEEAETTEEVTPVEETVIAPEAETGPPEVEPEPEAAEVPDWLQEMSEAEIEIAEEAEAVPAEALEVVEDTPDWLEDLRQGAEPVLVDEDEAEAEPVPVEDVVAGDDLFEEPEPEETPETDEAESPFEIPDWMQVSVEDEDEAGPLVEMPDTVDDTLVEEDVDVGETSDWATGADQGEAGDETIPVAPIEIPDWMQVVVEDEAEPEFSDQVISDEDVEDLSDAIPEWMQELREDEPDAELDEEVAESVAPVELPAWMQDLSEEEARPEEPGTPFDMEIGEDEEPTEFVIGDASEDVPAWMQELRGLDVTESDEAVVAEEEATTIPVEPVELPPWMQDLTEESEAVEPEVELPSETIDPEELEAESEPVVEEDIDDTLDRPQALDDIDTDEDDLGEDEDTVPVAELPEWMKDLPRPDLEPAEFTDPALPDEEPEAEETAEDGDLPDWGAMDLDAPDEFSVTDIDINGEDILLPAVDETDEDDVSARIDIADILSGEEPAAEADDELPEALRPSEPVSEVLSEVSGVVSTPAGFDAALSPQPPAGTDEAALEFYDVVNPVLESPVVADEARPSGNLFGKVLFALLNLTFLLLIAFPLFNHYDRGGYPFPWLEPSLAAQEETRSQLQSVVGIHPPDSIALVAFDYTPAFEGEMDPLANTVVKQLLGQGMRVIAISLEPEGQAVAGTVLENVTDPDDYGTKVVNLGYLPGGPIAIRNLTFDNVLANAVDVKSETRTPYKDLDDWPEIGTITDVNLVVEITAKPDMARWWIEQLQSVNPDYSHPMMLAVVSAAAEPFVRPYWDSHQYSGLIAGINGAAALESARPQKELGPATAQLDSQSVAHLLVLILILLGTIAGFISKYGQESN